MPTFINRSKINLMSMEFEAYLEQNRHWPQSGRHILAHFDDETIVVYQAYRPSIGRVAIEQQFLAGDFSYSRMSWIKPNFLWMMFRSGWGTKENQEITLGLRLRRSFFDSLLLQAVPSSWDRERYPIESDWIEAVRHSSVRLQWDPDHHPSGAKLERRAIQLGLRGEPLADFGKRELLEIIDLTEFVQQQRDNLSGRQLSVLRTPRERVYLPSDSEIVRLVGLDRCESNAS